MKPFVLAFAFSLLAGLVLAGCSNTFNGVGQDMENAGQYIQRQF